jgi:endonuclease/exonuclease/phosphatase family metal-dependent hydrolase
LTEPPSAGQKERADEIMRFRFASYNILNPAYEAAAASPGKSYHVWSNRRALVKQALEGVDLAVVVEGTPDTLGYLVDRRTHDLVFYKKPGELDGSAVIFRKTRFQLEGSCGCRLPRPTARDMQVALSVLLRDRETGKVFRVTALHLKSGPQFEAARLVELKLALRETSRWAQKQKVQPVAHIVSGDFNSNSRAAESPVRELMVRSEFQDVFEVYKKGEYHTFNVGGERILDYVFVRGGVRVSRRFIPAAGRVVPNGLQGSDHLPLYCDLE